MPKVSFDDLAAFSIVARMRNFTRAAAIHGTSTSNLSHTIRRLENAVGQRLLQRTSRSVAPTEAGQALLTALDPALDGIVGALESLDQGRDRVTGVLRLTATRQAYQAVVRPILTGFIAAHPDASVEVLIDYAFRDIVADRFDAGLRLGEKLERDMIALRVGPDLEMAVVASPDYLRGRPEIRTPHDLVECDCIGYRMTGSGALYAWEFEQAGQPLEVHVTGPLAFNEPDLMLDAALDGFGVAYLLADQVQPHVDEGRLCRLLADWTAPFPGFHLYYSSRRQMRPILRAFIDALRDARNTSA